jgi:2'-5' RNA ligase
VRLFAAVDPPEAEVTAFSAACGELPAGLRAVPSTQWHVTTAFYGEVPDGRLDELTERLARAAARSGPMTLALRGAGTFPKQAARARVLWVGLDGDLDVLSRLAERCVAAGRRSGLRMEDRAFRPHLTLGRARKETVDLRDTVVALSSYAGQPWQVTSLRLVRSHLGAHVRHETVAEWTLST